MPLLALTLDLDDTLWPVGPTIARADALMWQWLARQASATHAARDDATLRALRSEVARERPDWAHDLSALRRETVRRALLAAGDDPALAEPAFEVFFEERQRVALYDDVLPALARLAARWPLVALSNGNADVRRVPGLAAYFRAAVSASELGVGKPAPAAFAEACRRAGALPANTLHVGDDPALDVDGALDAGLQAAWVQRSDALSGRRPRGTAQHEVSRLDALADRLGV
ncbi:MAG: HAD family hydrolase [Burkholderiaceae bacterium]|nr:HAD family hydrolase [Burkholderiaceae bacterium]